MGNPYRNRWPSEEELKLAKQKENIRADNYDEEPDPICECGEPGWACCCEDIAKNTGYWFDGTPYSFPY